MRRDASWADPVTTTTNRRMHENNTTMKIAHLITSLDPAEGGHLWSSFAPSQRR